MNSENVIEDAFDNSEDGITTWTNNDNGTFSDDNGNTVGEENSEAEEDCCPGKDRYFDMQREWGDAAAAGKDPNKAWKEFKDDTNDTALGEAGKDAIVIVGSYYLGEVVYNLVLKGGKLGVMVASRAVNAFKIAQSGGKHAGFLKNYLGRSPTEIQKAINSLKNGKRGINVHLDKLANPSKYVSNWNVLRSGHQQSLIKGWHKEITNGREQIEILKAILK